ncbi:potassium/proton antiporter [Nocardiopsis metallicus]|uniref:Cell volume regulation protein A n=1 Tax=Nocardiopsis metallicus TaxID=179819 RepID=A0A840WFF6_9ACTN|nr:potassium/proton antiporter [Nocardiopsis metallicus]MBB5495699.1 cell volume regulation protein A [Nocardiopsis metallicus]
MSVQLPADGWILATGLLLMGAILAAGFASRIRMPGLLLFMALGMLIADDGLGFLSLEDPRIAQIGGTVALLLILFEGGLTTKPGDVRRAAAPGFLLATVGVVVTAGILGWGTYLLLDVEPLTAFLIGAVVASTDAAAVFAMLRKAPLPRKLASLLEVESGANDPIAIMLTVGLVATWQGAPTPTDWGMFALVQLGGGIAVGLLVGWAGSWLLSRINLGPAGVYPVLALAVAGISYGTAAALGASGFLAVYITGLLVGARAPLHRRGIRTFHEGLSNTAEVGLFLMLGMLVFPSELPAVTAPALAVAVMLVLVARPIAVMVSLVWFGYNWRELVFISWVGLRGAVPIVLATFPFVAGHPDGPLIFNVVFFVVLVSAAVQGASIQTAARWLGLTQGDNENSLAPVASDVPLSDVNTELIEVTATPGLYIVGKQLDELDPPHGLVTTVVRGSHVLIPTPRTRIREGDLIILAMPRRPDASKLVTAWAKGEGTS